MQFSHWFPMTSWVWRQRTRIACAALLLFLSWMLVATALNAAYIFRANRVLNLVLMARPQTDQSTEAALKRYCPVPETVPVTGEQIYVCSKGDVFHPYLRITAYYDSDVTTHELRNLELEIVLRRSGYEPLSVQVRKALIIEGAGMRFLRRPNVERPAGIAIYLERDAVLNMRVNYKCALPFVNCVLLEDLITR